MEELYLKNLELFKKYDINLATAIENASLEHFNLDVSQGEVINIKYNDENLYPTYPDVSAEIQVNEFKKSPKSYSMYPVKQDEDAGDIHDKFIKKMQDASPALGKSGQYIHKGVFVESDQIPLLLVSGCGAGYHIQKLIENFEIFNLIIYDQDFSFLKLSMHLIDWSPILEYFGQSNRNLYIVAQKDEEKMAHSILNKIKEINPVLVTILYFFQHLKSDFSNKVMTNILDKGFLLVLGWGFYDDEIIGLDNTINNIKLDIPIYSGIDFDDHKIQDMPLFIIGSGPSLDNDIEFIKQNKDKAIICSAGSGLSVLYHHGITPNFHFEVERMPMTKEDGTKSNYTSVALEKYSKEYLSNINFLGLNVLFDEVFDVFKKKYLFFRTNDAGSTIIEDKITRLTVTNPSVVNAVVSFATILNFKNVYLFGTDSGYKNKDLTHSKDSLYYKKQPSYVKDLDLGIEEFRRVKGNFCDEVVTDVSLSWIKEVIEMVIRKKNPQTTFYNCSDGAFIQGTKPLHSKDINLNELYTQEQKEEIFLRYFKNYSKEDLIKYGNIEVHINQVIYDIEEIQAVCQKYMTQITKREVYLIIQNLYEYMTKRYQLTKQLIGGTLKVLSSFAYMHIMASDNKARNDFYAKYYLKIVNDFLEYVKKDLTNKFLNELERKDSK